jgi:lincosamide nucleotidyltransferase A/C/D/E
MHGDQRASAWTRFTNRLAALVWAVPLPRRLQVLLSQLVYRSPPIPEQRVVEALEALERTGIRSVMVGGWGIDALLGRQLRAHRDLDLLVEEGHLERAFEVLTELGYEEWYRDSSPDAIGGLPIAASTTCRDRALRVVELHGVDFARLQPARGRLGDRAVLCFSAEQQLRAQVGRTWTLDRRSRKQMNLEAVKAALERRNSAGRLPISR